MATAVSNQLKMKYRNESHGLVTQSLNDPKADLTAETVMAVMTNVVTEDIFTTTGGDITNPDSAFLVETTETQLF